jgi:hypothetical protein
MGEIVPNFQARNDKLNSATETAQFNVVSILCNVGIKFLRPGRNTASNIDHVLKPLGSQECRHAVAANAMVAQTRDGLTRVQLGQARGDFAHRNRHQREPVGRDRGDLQFNRLAHIQHHRCAVLSGLLQPGGKLRGADLWDH